MISLFEIPVRRKEPAWQAKDDGYHDWHSAGTKLVAPACARNNAGQSPIKRQTAAAALIMQKERLVRIRDILGSLLKRDGALSPFFLTVKILRPHVGNGIPHLKQRCLPSCLKGGSFLRFVGTRLLL